MESVNETTLVTDRWFTFTKEEAKVLAFELLNTLDWENIEQGAHCDFFLKLYKELDEVVTS